MKVKTIFEEQQKREKWWDNLNVSDKFELVKSFTQIYGGEPDQELEVIVSERFIKEGVPSVKFMENLLRLIKSGKPFILNGYN